MAAAKKTSTRNNETLEQKLWKSADKLRKNIDAAEYKHRTYALTNARQYDPEKVVSVRFSKIN